MKVSELFAEIGFKVDTRGLADFSNSMKSIKETIKDCVSGLKEFAKAAEQINKAVEKIRSAYVPTQKEAAQRYRAETYYFRSAGKELRGRAAMEKGKGALFQVNSDFREQQEERLARQSQTNRERLELQKLNYELNKAKFEYRKEHQTDVSGSVTIGTIIGNIVAKAITGLLSQLKGWIMGALSFIKDTIRAAMAYRDYRTFTGRSVSELSGLMGMTAYTTSMTPQDILKDAQGFQKQYWDMWFGKASPEAWMRLGIMPTGNGAQDLRNVLRAIYNFTNKGTNTGMAASLLSTFGLDEQYMNIFKAMREGRKNEFLVMDEQIDKFEQANNSLNEFSLAIDEVKRMFVETLLKSGLKEMLNYLVETLKIIVSMLRSGAFVGKSPTEALSMIWDAFAGSDTERKYMQKTGKHAGRFSPTLGEYALSLFSENLAATHAANRYIDRELSLKSGKQIDLSPTIGEYLRAFISPNWAAKHAMERLGSEIKYLNNVEITNNFDYTNRDLDESTKSSSDIITKQMFIRDGMENRSQINTATATAATM